MCQIMEELTAKAIANATVNATVFTKQQNAIKLLKREKLTLDEIAEDLGLSLDEVKKLAREQGNI